MMSPQPVEEVGGGQRRLLGCRHVVGRAALEDGCVKQSLRTWRSEQCPHAHGTGGLAEDRHVLGVAAEALDVVPYPFEHGDLVAQPQIGLG
jgi:hypothetical protein